MLENVSQQIPADHPNAAGLRRKLTITNQKARRGLITPEEAERQRAETRKATERKPRKDWKPSPEAQKRMDKRHREENNRLMNGNRS
jgi:cytochrome c-type biogenesis protein CcmH/NrfG